VLEKKKEKEKEKEKEKKENENDGEGEGEEQAQEDKVKTESVTAGGSAPFPHGDPSRIDIYMVEQGKGSKVGPTGAVEIEYTGYLPSGKEFIRHKEVIQLGQKRNIKGLEQACTQIPEGGRVRLWIPSKLAYGSKGGGTLIPPNSDLTFELYVLKVHRQ